MNMFLRFFLLTTVTLDRADPLGQNGPHRRVRVFLALNLYKTTCVMAMSLGLFLVPTQLLSARKGTAMITCGSNKNICTEEELLLNLNQENLFCYLNASMCFTAVSFSSFLTFAIKTFFQSPHDFKTIDPLNDPEYERANPMRQRG